MDKRSHRIFVKEMVALFAVHSGIRNAKSKRVKGLQVYIDVLRKILVKANTQYRDVSFSISNSGVLSVFVKDKNVKAVFDEAMKLDGVSGIGVARFDSATVENTEGFSAFASQISDTAYLTYKRGQNGNSTVLLRKASKRGYVHVEFEPDGESHPGIVLLAEYALRSVKGDADLLEQLQGIGFIDDPDVYGEREWKKGFDPKMDDI
ncbi:MAG: hypothetical protein O2779_00305 [Nanoarchaeota archaeon]|nr:hypothetical protein [Nanoarchaeota archaeon]